MKSYDHGRPRRRRAPGEWRTPEQLALAFEQAVRWRALRRARALLPDEAIADAARIAVAHSEAKDAARRARLASAIARAEFGRFYRGGEVNGSATKPTKTGRWPSEPDRT